MAQPFVRAVAIVRRASASTLEAVAPWGLLIIALLALDWAAGTAAGWPEAVLVFRLALLYGLYRIGIDGGVVLLLRLAGHEAWAVTGQPASRLHGRPAASSILVPACSTLLEPRPPRRCRPGSCRPQ